MSSALDVCQLITDYNSIGCQYHPTYGTALEGMRCERCGEVIYTDCKIYFVRIMEGTESRSPAVQRLTAVSPANNWERRESSEEDSCDDNF